MGASALAPAWQAPAGGLSPAHPPVPRGTETLVDLGLGFLLLPSSLSWAPWKQAKADPAVRASVLVQPPGDLG